MKWREKMRMFALTKEEQRTIAFIVLMLALGLLTKHYRATHPAQTPRPNELHATATPTP